MPDFEPVLLAKSASPTAIRCACIEQAGGYQALQQGAGGDDAEGRDRDRQGQQPARPRRGGLSDRAEVDLPAARIIPGPIYLCLNADESEPGTFNNRILMEEDPHQVIEGLILSCYATRRHARPTSTCGTNIRSPGSGLQQAIDECYAAGYLGKNILGSGYSLDIFLHRGAAAYICGEETGLIESLEGKRAWPRIKPPFPAVEGAFRKPTVVNNVETVACVHAHRRPRRRLVQVDRRAARSEQPARRRQLRAEALLPVRPRQQARLLRSAAGHHRAGS